MAHCFERKLYETLGAIFLSLRWPNVNERGMNRKSQNDFSLKSKDPRERRQGFVRVHEEKVKIEIKWKEITSERERERERAMQLKGGECGSTWTITFHPMT